MLKDIQNRSDLYLIVSEFYSKLFINDEVKHFFEKFKQDEILEEHLQILVDFWDNILFYSGTYSKNAMQPHINLNLEKPLKKEHFETWLHLFNQSVDENFKGTNSETIKNRALSIATVMQIKILNLQ